MKDPISRTSGVGDVQLFGSQYAMRIWMNPTELTKYQLTPVDVINAIKAQNARVAAGQLGGTPPVKASSLTHRLLPKRV
ncbi:efflux RND transporter permease subunit [Salmonella sp. WGH-01]|nr:efflux RND transporter permease subunit [Salmonella sp. WGH-01]